MILDLPDDLAHALLAAGVGRAVEVWPVAEREDVMAGHRPIPSQAGELNETEAAAHLGIEVDRLRSYRRNETGPKYRRSGRMVFYPVDELELWASCKLRPVDRP